MKRLLSKLALVLLLFTFAVLSAGLLRLYTLVLALLVSVIVALLFEKVLVKRSLSLRDIVRVLYLLEFLVRFIHAEIKAHAQVTKIILLGKSVKPAIVAIPYSVESEYGLALVALSITNTPGTLVLHVDKTTKTMYVHWINATTFDPVEAQRRISREFERLAKKVFG